MNENMDMEKQENGQITYANEVIATIVSVATTEVQGISGISGAGAISGILGKGKSPRGVKVDMTGGNIKVDISVTVDYGIPIQKVGRNVQENVRKSIETMTGLHVEKVDLHVVGVSFEKENQELQQGQKLAMSLEGDKEHAEEKESVNAPDEEKAYSVQAEEDDVNVEFEVVQGEDGAEALEAEDDDIQDDEDASADEEAHEPSDENALSEEAQDEEEDSQKETPEE